MAKAVAPSEAARKSHHKKKMPIIVQPIGLDTIYDSTYVPEPPFPLLSDEAFEPLDWEAPLEKKARSRNRKAGAPAGQKDAKLSEPEQTHIKKSKKARKRPMVDSKAKAAAQKKDVAHEVRKEDLAAGLRAEACEAEALVHAPPALARSSPHAHATSARKELGW